MDGMTEGLTDIRTYVQTHPLIEMQGRIKKKNSRNGSIRPLMEMQSCTLIFLGGKLGLLLGVGGKKTAKHSNAMKK